MIAMLVVGGLLLPVLIFWDFKIAKYPVIAPRFCMNRSVVLAALIGAFDFVSGSLHIFQHKLNSTQISFYLTFTFLYSFVVVVKPW